MQDLRRRLGEKRVDEFEVLVSVILSDLATTLGEE